MKSVRERGQDMSKWLKWSKLCVINNHKWSYLTAEVLKIVCLCNSDTDTVKFVWERGKDMLKWLKWSISLVRNSLGWSYLSTEVIKGVNE